MTLLISSGTIVPRKYDELKGQATKPSNVSVRYQGFEFALAKYNIFRLQRNGTLLLHVNPQKDGVVRKAEYIPIEDLNITDQVLLDKLNTKFVVNTIMRLVSCVDNISLRLPKVDELFPLCRVSGLSEVVPMDANCDYEDLRNVKPELLKYLQSIEGEMEGYKTKYMNIIVAMQSATFREGLPLIANLKQLLNDYLVFLTQTRLNINKSIYIEFRARVERETRGHEDTDDDGPDEFDERMDASWCYGAASGIGEAEYSIDHNFSENIDRMMLLVVSLSKDTYTKILREPEVMRENEPKGYGTGTSYAIGFAGSAM